MNGPIRVLVVEDENDARDLLVLGLQRLGFHAQGARDGQEAIDRLSERWDVVVTDLLMPRVDGLRLLAEIQQNHPHLHRIVITSFGDKERVLASFNAGADYLLEKPFGVAQLADVIQRLHGSDGRIEQWFNHRMTTLNLTERERDLVLLVMKGLSNKQIAQRLDLSPQTVKNALFILYQKLGITSRAELFHLVFPV